jgi:hypothetical protein
MTRLIKAYLEFRAQSDDEGQVTMSAQGEGDLPPPFTVKVFDVFCGQIMHLCFSLLILWS